MADKLDAAAAAPKVVVDATSDVARDAQAPVKETGGPVDRVGAQTRDLTAATADRLGETGGGAGPTSTPKLAHLAGGIVNPIDGVLNDPVGGVVKMDSSHGPVATLLGSIADPSRPLLGGTLDRLSRTTHESVAGILDAAAKPALPTPSLVVAPAGGPASGDSATTSGLELAGGPLAPASASSTGPGAGSHPVSIAAFTTAVFGGHDAASASGTGPEPASALSDGRGGSHVAAAISSAVSAAASSSVPAIALLLMFALLAPKLLSVPKEAPAFLRPAPYIALLERPG